MAQEAMLPPTCAGHPARKARAACVRCGRYVCEECLRVGEDGALCPDCGGAERAPAVSVSRQAPRVAASDCAYHPGARAAAFCAHCGAPLCQDCRSGVGDKAFCPECFAFVYRVRPAAPAARPCRTPAGGGAAWKLWPGLAFLPFPFLLEFLVTYMINEGGEVSWGVAVLFISAILYASMLAFAAWQVGGQDAGGEGWLKKLGVSGRNLKESLPWGLLGGLASFGFTLLLLSLSERLLQDWGWIESWLRGLTEVNVQAGAGRADLVIAFAVVVVAGPACEEAFFRGYLYPPMRRELGAAAAVAANAALFSLVHFSLVGLLSRMAAGCIFCALYEHTDNLAAPVTAHMLNNLLVFLLTS